jgi:glycosyltransferase involved in cell wall biosynthesis
MTTRVLMLSKACIVGIYQRKLEEIAKQGIELLTLVPPSWRDERGEMPLERVYTNGYRLETVPIYFNGKFHLHFYGHLREKMRDFQAQIVHIDEEPYNISAWQAFYHARRLGAKTVFFSWQNITRRYPPPFSWGERWLLNNIDYAIAGTESAAQVWREKDYRGEIAVIPQFGTDPALFQPSTHHPNRAFTIGFFGRLVEEKGVFTLLDAVKKLKGDWRLRFLGGGPLLEALKHHTAKLNIADRVDFQGQVASTDMPTQYHQVDTLVLPSLTRPNWKEQFGRVLVEAMASGVPVIGSDSGAIPDVIGDAGLIVPEGDAQALAGAIQRLYDNPALRADLAQKGRARVLTHFTHDQVAAATVQVYQRLMAKDH